MRKIKNEQVASIFHILMLFAVFE